VGFLPTSACGQTYSVVNFESVNQLYEGRYFDGFAATCPVAEDFTVAQGGADDPLLNVARQVADANGCPRTPLASAQAQTRRAATARRLLEGDEQRGMIPR
jgi:carboxyl-terminal processing protease